VGSSIYYGLGLVAIFALGMTPIVYLVAGVIFVMTAMTYAEATANFPEAGGASSFARRAFNEFASFFAGWAQILNYVITVSISAFFVPHYLSVFWAPLAHSPADIFAGIGVVGLLSALNIRGVRESTRINLVLAGIDFATQALLMLLGFFLILNFGTLIHNIHLGVAPTWSDLAIAVPIAMISYTGMETISNLSEEAMSPRRFVPKAYRYLVILVLVIYIGLPAVGLSAMPVTHDAGGYTTTLAHQYAGDPILGIVKNMGLGAFTRPMEIYVGMLAATILLIAANAGIIGVSRLTYSMGRHQQLPERLRRVSARSRTPVTAIVVFGVIASLAILPGQEQFLGTIYAFGAMLSFTTAHVAVVGLRWRLGRDEMKQLPGDVEVKGDEASWYRAPLNFRFNGVDFPLFALIGGLGTLTAWVTVMILYHDAAIAGAIWMVLGIATYVVYRRRKGLSLTEVEIAKLPPLSGARPVSYTGVLVAFEEDQYSESAMATALKLAAHRRGDVRVLVTIEVPQHLSMDAALPQAEEKAQAVIETARQWAGRGQRIRGQIVKVRPREAGHRIVEVTRHSGADAIVLAMAQHRQSNGKLLSPALETVLRKRPCRVIIDSARTQPLVRADTPPRPSEPRSLRGRSRRRLQAGEEQSSREEDRMTWKASILVIANRTAGSGELLEALRTRSERGSAAFTILIPGASENVDAAVERLRAAGLEVTATHGHPDPIVAVREEWDPSRFDEVIVSTLPTNASKWLQIDLPHRVAKITGASVTHVVASAPDTTPASAPEPVPS
jgi:basic amino acid/polyamine antiporter, APA family